MYSELFKEALEKHVVLVMKNDTIIQGTVLDVVASKLKLLEYDKNIIIADINDISLLRINNKDKEPYVRSLWEEEQEVEKTPQNKPRGYVQSLYNDFSMTTPRQDSPRGPVFKRKT